MTPGGPAARGEADGPLRGSARRCSDKTLLVGLLLVSFLCWRGVLAVGFQFDDENNIQGQAELQKQPSPVSAIAETLRGPSARAITTWSFRMDYALWGLDPRGFHATTFFMHVACVWVVWILARRGLGGLCKEGPAAAGAWIGACVFAIHPIQAEAVAYLSARGTVLSVLFGLAGILAADGAYLRFSEGRRVRAVWLAMGAGFSFLLSIGAMPSGVVFPPLAVFWLWGIRRAGRKVLLAGGGASVLLFGVFSAQVAAFLQTRRLARAADYPAAYWLTQPECLLRGVGLMVLPVGLTVDHDILPIGLRFTPPPSPKFPVETGAVRQARYEATGCSELFSVGEALRDLRFWKATLALTALAAAGVFWGTRRSRPVGLPVAAQAGRAALAGACAFGLSYLPAAASPLEDLFFEHRWYAAFAWVAWLVALAAARIVGSVRHETLPCWAALAVGIGFWWGWLDQERLQTWQGTDRLWVDALRKGPAKPRPRFNLATSWFRSRRGPLTEVERLCNTASVSFVRYRDNDNLKAEIHNLMGGVYQSLGQPQNAYLFHKLASQMLPGAWEFRWNLAMAALAVGRFDEAADLFAQLSRMRPDETEFQVRWAMALDDLEKLEEARTVLVGILLRHPDHSGAAVTLARVLTRQGKLGEAILWCRETARRSPSAPVFYNLAVALARSGRNNEAREALVAAFRMDPGLVTPQDALWKALAAAPPGASEKPKEDGQ